METTPSEWFGTLANLVGDTFSDLVDSASQSISELTTATSDTVSKFTESFVESSLFEQVASHGGQLVSTTPQLPPPKGPYPVGTISYHWEDEVTSKEYPWSTQVLVSRRKFHLKFFYPSEEQTPSHQIAPYVTEHHKMCFSTGKGVPSFYNTHIKSNTKAHAILGSNLSNKEKTWPVILFSHGQGSSPDKMRFLTEHLVSFGYIVVQLFHDDSLHGYPGPLKRRFENVGSAIGYIFSLNQNEKLPVEVMDGQTNLFHERLNLEKGIAMLGHSFGATITALLCTKYGTSQFNPQPPPVPIQCGVGLDAWFTNLAEEDLHAYTPDRPLMLCLADLWNGRFQEKISIFSTSSESILYEIWLKNSFHQNFTDLPFLVKCFPENMVSLESDGTTPNLGPTDGIRTVYVVAELVTEFFRKYFPASIGFKEGEGGMEVDVSVVGEGESLLGVFQWEHGKVVRSNGVRPEKEILK